MQLPRHIREQESARNQPSTSWHLFVMSSRLALVLGFGRGRWMQHVFTERIPWREALKRESPLLLPVAHDALTAHVIEQAGFSAVQIGGFAVEGSRHGVPDINLTHFGERYAAVQDIMAATSLPIMVDADNGYGEEKNDTYNVEAFEEVVIRASFSELKQSANECRT